MFLANCLSVWACFWCENSGFYDSMMQNICENSGFYDSMMLNTWVFEASFSKPSCFTYSLLLSGCSFWSDLLCSGSQGVFLMWKQWVLWFADAEPVWKQWVLWSDAAELVWKQWVLWSDVAKHVWKQLVLWFDDAKHMSFWSLFLKTLVFYIVFAALWLLFLEWFLLVCVCYAQACGF